MNMNKQYRAELRDLKRNKKLEERSFVQFTRAHLKAAAILRREHQRALARTVKATGRIEKRIAILEGRLS